MRTSCIVVLLSLGACGDPLIFAEIEEKRVCVRQVGQSLPGFAPGGSYSLSITYDGTYDLGASVAGLNEKGVTGTLEPLDFTLQAEGDVDLSGVTTASVSVSRPGASPESVLALGAGGHPSRDSLVLTGESVDVMPYLEGGELRYVVDAAGSSIQLPRSDWSASLELCVYAKVQVDPLALGGN